MRNLKFIFGILLVMLGIIYPFIVRSEALLFAFGSGIMTKEALAGNILLVSYILTLGFILIGIVFMLEKK